MPLRGLTRNAPCQSGGHVLRALPFKYLLCCRRSQKMFSSAGQDSILFDIIRSPLRIPVHPRNVTSHPVGSAHVLTTPEHKNQMCYFVYTIPYTCRAFWYQIPQYFNLLQRNILGPVATVNVNVHESKTSISMTLSYTLMYICIVSLHVHYTSMQALCLLGLHATVQGAGLQCIRACLAGVYVQQPGITYGMPVFYKLTPS